VSNGLLGPPKIVPNPSNPLGSAPIKSRQVQHVGGDIWVLWADGALSLPSVTFRLLSAELRFEAVESSANTPISNGLILTYPYVAYLPHWDDVELSSDELSDYVLPENEDIRAGERLSSDSWPDGQFVVPENAYTRPGDVLPPIEFGSPLKLLRVPVCVRIFFINGLAMTDPEESPPAGAASYSSGPYNALDEDISEYPEGEQDAENLAEALNGSGVGVDGGVASISGSCQLVADGYVGPGGSQIFYYGHVECQFTATFSGGNGPFATATDFLKEFKARLAFEDSYRGAAFDLRDMLDGQNSSVSVAYFTSAVSASATIIRASKLQRGPDADELEEYGDHFSVPPTPEPLLVDVDDTPPQPGAGQAKATLFGPICDVYIIAGNKAGAGVGSSVPKGTTAYREVHLFAAADDVGSDDSDQAIDPGKVGSDLENSVDDLSGCADLVAYDGTITADSAAETISGILSDFLQRLSQQ